MVAPSVSGLRVLLVEDDLICREIALVMLERLDQQADVAGNGIEALAATGAAPYDVVLMDIRMPQMDGVEATRRIRAELPPALQPVIVAMTAGVTVEEQVLYLQTGMNDILPKPVRMGDLGAMLARYGVPDG
jgi:CheY-like chemotaxis protein